MKFKLLFSGSTKGGSAYGDIYQPNLFGSAGGGVGGGRGGGRIWMNISNTLHIDGSLTANSGHANTINSEVSGGGSGGSIWVYADRITGFGLIQATGGNGSLKEIYVDEMVSSDGLEKYRCETTEICSSINMCQNVTTCQYIVCQSDDTCTGTDLDERFSMDGNFSCSGNQNCERLCNTEEICGTSGSCAEREVCYDNSLTEWCYQSVDSFYDSFQSNWNSEYICCHIDTNKQYDEVCCYDNAMVNNGTHWVATQACCYPEQDYVASYYEWQQTCCYDGSNCITRDITNSEQSRTKRDPPTRDVFTFSSSLEETAGGGGAGGRVSINFAENVTFSEFRYLANGGYPGRECDECEAGGPGTVYIYHLIEDHSTLIIDNNGAPPPITRYVNWDSLDDDGGRAWIIPIAGSHPYLLGYDFMYAYRFDEIQIYGNGELAVWPPVNTNEAVSTNRLDISYTSKYENLQSYNVMIFFKYMIGDRTGTVHVGGNQILDLMTFGDQAMAREEVDLPYNAYSYADSILGLGPITYVHDVDIHVSGTLINVLNMTLRHGGYVWLKNGGHTQEEETNHYKFDFVQIQDDSTLNATTDPVSEEGITFTMRQLTIDGGGTLHGTYLTLNMENITVDAGGLLSSHGLGYRTEHTDTEHGSASVHGTVNPGRAPSTGCGGGHGGSGGRETSSTYRSGFANGNIFEPRNIGSSGGSGQNGATGGRGGGRMWFNITDTIFVDGVVSADGGDGTNNGAGGGSGGSIWMHCNEIQGYGLITAHGGAGSNYTSDTGSGGSGGRVAIYFQKNSTMSTFRVLAYGGNAGGSNSEAGGAGTVFLYHMGEDHQTLVLDNNGYQCRDPLNVIDDYSDLQHDSCRTWILPESGYSTFTDGAYRYNFNELQIYGDAHFAVLPHPGDTPVDIFFLYMIGDRTGTVHLGDAQVMDLERYEIDLPFNVRAYAGSYLGLAPNTIVHDVTIWLHGQLDHVENITLHHKGYLALHQGAFTTGNLSDHFHFLWVRIQDNATISILTDPVTDPQTYFGVTNTLSMEGAGNFFGTNMNIQCTDMVIDNGATIHADGLGYRPEDPKTSTNNLGLGYTSDYGSSGGGHGGTSGKGAGTSFTGQPYGHLFEPKELGSAGGGGADIGGQGGGRINIKVSSLIQIDGEIRSNGGDAKHVKGGGGSGGTVVIDTYGFRGMGNITSNGGSRASSGYGGAGAGGRIAIYFRENVTYWGTYQCHGGYSTGSGESGGPGIVFIYNVKENHSTLYINNNNRQTTDDVNLLYDYTDISQDRFKGWILPASSDHWLAGGSGDYSFDELQIYGNAHLAMMPENHDDGCTLFFRHMIGDRTGYIHIGPNQEMDLYRGFIDVPFSAYVYFGGYLGLAPETFVEKVFIHVEGTVDHIHNLTLIQGGGMKFYKTGSTNRLDSLNYQILGKTVIKADSYINCSNPNADTDAYQLVFGWVIIEGGGLIKGGHLNIQATDFTVDDGGLLDVSNGGHRPQQGTGNIYFSILTL